jgi:XTP/dITP diphosphohydrolase
MSQLELVLATRNRDKIAELSRLFAELGFSAIRGAVDIEGLGEVEESGSTLAENALLKARAVAAATGSLAIADDTGLFVEALDGAPGIHAARYAGEGCSYEDNCRKLLGALEGVAGPRRAAFRTAMALVDPIPGMGNIEIVVEGVLEGEILTEMRGEGGFGYDPLFLVAGEGRTLAEMDLDEKNRISHRARAAETMRRILGHYLEEREEFEE